MVQSLWEMVRRFLKKLNTELPCDPAISPLGIHPTELKSGTLTDICAAMFTVALLRTAKRWKQTKHPHEWMNKTLQWGEILTHAAIWMNLRMLCEVTLASHTKNSILPDSTYTSV